MNYFYSSVTVPHKYLLETELEVNHRSLVLISVGRERRKRRRVWLQKEERRQAEYTCVVSGHKVTADLSADLLYSHPSPGWGLF